ncbi:MAG: hypothetical protein AB2L07_18970 [Thermoanaerobaculaceae bacterium]
MLPGCQSQARERDWRRQRRPVEVERRQHPCRRQRRGELECLPPEARLTEPPGEHPTRLQQRVGRAEVGAHGR